MLYSQATCTIATILMFCMKESKMKRLNAGQRPKFYEILNKKKITAEKNIKLRKTHLIKCCDDYTTSFLLLKVFSQIIQLVFNRTTRKLQWMYDNRINFWWWLIFPNFIHQIFRSLNQLLVLSGKSMLPSFCSVYWHTPRINTNGRFLRQILKERKHKIHLI